MIVERRDQVLMTFFDFVFWASTTFFMRCASMKGPLVMQSAISALQACQPYTMLPADRYREWKVLDLTFTPQDLSGAS